jgi:hypothetical protein
VFAIENRGDNGNIAIWQQESCFAVFNFSISF